ncbi:MAG TPA: phosphatase PAP2 family protein [Pseudonocardiaceae bacterium]|jgi:membrane-associated phospholipid phosphatase|nr:phosphatase PAP2 family protein [Pseudonocardiaceae bacterium]
MYSSTLDHRPADRPPEHEYPPVGWLLAGALTAAFGVGGLYLLFVRDPLGRRVDTAAMDAVMDRSAGLGARADQILATVSISTVCVGTVLAVLVAVLRRRPLAAALAVGTVLAANVLAELLKLALIRPVGSNSLPSGHVTAVASVFAALLLVVAPGWRPLVWLAGIAGVGAVAVSVVVAGWHRPSDVLAALLLVAGIAALAAAVGRRFAGRAGESPGNAWSGRSDQQGLFSTR